LASFFANFTHGDLIIVRFYTTNSDIVTTTANIRGRFYIHSIMKDFEAIPNSNGMSVLHDVCDLASNTKSTVVLRSITEDFWTKAIESVKRYHVCVVGTPGIGKTTATCILIRLLLQANRTVVYRVKTLNKDGVVFYFRPCTISNAIHVQTAKEKDFSYNTINNPSTYYFVDPGKTNNSCNPERSLKGNIIIVASTDERHWGGSQFWKHCGSDGCKSSRCMDFPVWSLEELLASSYYFAQQPNDHEIKRRFNVVGGIPGYIFATNFEQIESAQHHAMSMLSSQSMESIAFHSDVRRGHYVHGVDKDLLLSSHLKDNDNGSYKESYASLCSHSVYTYVAKNFMKEIWPGMVHWSSDFDAGFDTGI
jgi:hypothetical protein